MVPSSRIRLVNAAPVQPGQADGSLLDDRLAAHSGQLRPGARGRPRPQAGEAAGRAGGAARRPRLGQRPLPPVRAGRHARQRRRVGRPSGVTYFPYLETEPGRGQRPSRPRWAHTPRSSSPTTSRASSCRAWWLPPARGSTCASKPSTAMACCRSAHSTAPFPLPLRSAARGSRCSATHLAERPEPEPLAAALEAPAWAIPRDISSRWPDVFSWLATAEDPWEPCRLITGAAHGRSAAGQPAATRATRRVPRPGSDVVRHRSQRSGSRRREPPVAIPALGTPRRTRRVRSPDGPRGLVGSSAGQARPAPARAGGVCRRPPTRSSTSSSPGASSATT